ncbi:MAG: caspase family protein [Anaerolineae bacterium]|nr:caspase family protein [Anaerolineae bacterium]
MATEFSLDFKNKYRTLLANNFNLDELQVLTSSLGIDFEEIRGSSKTIKVLELIEHMRRRGMLADLVQASVTFHSPSKVDWSVLGNEVKPFLQTAMPPEKRGSGQRGDDDEIRHKGQMMDDDGVIQDKSIKDIGPIKQRHALLVGINNFDDSKYNALKFCENDANAMTEKLQGLGFQCTKMLGSNQGSNLYPTRVNILAQLNRICSITEREDLTLLYFATHGVRFGDDQVPYLVAKDTQSAKELFQETAVSIDRVIEMLKKSKSRRHVLLLDACHVGVDRGSDDEQEKFHKYVYDRAQGIALLAASAADQTAVEQDGHGLFTRFLLDGLSDKADRNKKGFITTTDLSNYVLYRVRDWYDTRHLHRQDPTYRIEGLGDMILAELKSAIIS